MLWRRVRGGHPDFDEDTAAGHAALTAFETGETMKIGKHTLSLAAALVIGGALLSLSTGEVEARKRREDDGVRCWAYGGWGGDYTFYMPGAVLTHGNGRKDKCGTDGEWIIIKAGKNR